MASENFIESNRGGGATDDPSVAHGYMRPKGKPSVVAHGHISAQRRQGKQPRRGSF